MNDKAAGVTKTFYSEKFGQTVTAVSQSNDYSTTITIKDSNGNTLAIMKTYPSKPAYIQIYPDDQKRRYSLSEWKFHISVDPEKGNFDRAFKEIFQFCKKHNIKFKYANHKFMNEFDIGNRQQGKIFTLYIEKGTEHTVGAKVIDDLGTKLRIANIKTWHKIHTDLQADDHIFYRHQKGSDDNYRRVEVGNAIPQGTDDIYKNKRIQYQKRLQRQQSHIHSTSSRVSAEKIIERKVGKENPPKKIFMSRHGQEVYASSITGNDGITTITVYDLNGNVIENVYTQENRGWFFVVPHGTPEYTDTSGWKFHISVDPNSENFSRAYKEIFQFCKKYNIKFKYADPKSIKDSFSEGKRQAGKIFALNLPRGTEKTIGYKIIDELGVKLRASNVKPWIPVTTDLKVDDHIYYRYQGEYDLSKRDELGRPIGYIPANEGKAIPEGVQDIYESRRSKYVERLKLQNPEINQTLNHANEETRLKKLQDNITSETQKNWNAQIEKDEKDLEKKFGKAATQEFNGKQRRPTNKQSRRDRRQNNSASTNSSQGSFNASQSGAYVSPTADSANVNKVMNKSLYSFFDDLWKYIKTKTDRKPTKPRSSAGPMNPLAEMAAMGIEMLGGIVGSKTYQWLDYIIASSTSYFALQISTTGSVFSVINSYIYAAFGKILPKTCTVLLNFSVGSEKLILAAQQFVGRGVSFVGKPFKAIYRTLAHGGKALVNILSKFLKGAARLILTGVKAIAKFLTLKVILIGYAIVSVVLVFAKIFKLLSDGPEPNQVKTKIFINSDGSYFAQRSCLDGPRQGRLADIPLPILKEAMEELRKRVKLDSNRFLSEENYKLLLTIGREIQFDKRKNVPIPAHLKKHNILDQQLKSNDKREEVMVIPYLSGTADKYMSKAEAIESQLNQAKIQKNQAEKRLKKGAKYINNKWIKLGEELGITNNGEVISKQYTEISDDACYFLRQKCNIYKEYCSTVSDLTKAYYYAKKRGLTKSNKKKKIYTAKFKKYVKKHKSNLKTKNMQGLFGKYKLDQYLKKLNSCGQKSLVQKGKKVVKMCKNFENNMEKFYIVMHTALEMQYKVDQQIKSSPDEVLAALSHIQADMVLVESTS